MLLNCFSLRRFNIVKERIICPLCDVIHIDDRTITGHYYSHTHILTDIKSWFHIYTFTNAYEIAYFGDATCYVSDLQFLSASQLLTIKEIFDI